MRCWNRSSSEAQSLDAAKLKEAALKLNDKIVTVTGPYEIDDTGKQFKNEFAVMQNMPNGPEVVYPPEVATAKAVYPVPRLQGPQVAAASQGAVARRRLQRDSHTEPPNSRATAKAATDGNQRSRNDTMRARIGLSGS